MKQYVPDWMMYIYSVFQPYLPLLASTSIVMALASMIIIPWLIVKMPADYFCHHHRERHWNATRVLFYVVRNAFALVLFIAGFIMLILPGQGLLTILIAIIVSDVPGKYLVERWLLAQKSVYRSMNWIRRHYNKEPLKKPSKEDK
ncbi:hypothetical protein [Aliidiomarina haloalkalitolerans]|nr:hypothetical protein [Aliidiomarina haloalkalitolerans]